MFQSMVSLKPWTSMVQSGIINGPDYDQTETFVAHTGSRDMQFRENSSNIETHQLYRLNALILLMSRCFSFQSK